MKKQLKKWIFRITVTGLTITGLLFVIVLNPILTYANKTTHKNYTIFHDKKLDSSLLITLDRATSLLQSSEFYNPDMKLDICLNDGSMYPTVIRTIRGQAFGWGFYNKVVLQGSANYRSNYVELNGQRWNLTQLLAHEMTHCLQFDKLGFWESRPLTKIAMWKWEGYAEYIARQNNDQTDLYKDIERLLSANKINENSWEIAFSDNTIAPREYYDYWLLVKYCIDIKKMSYKQILETTIPEQTLQQEMMHWFNK